MSKLGKRFNRRLASIMVFVMLLTFFNVFGLETLHVSASENLITQGNYIYSSAPDSSGPDQSVYDVGQTGLISFANGSLTSGNGTNNLQWIGKADSPGKVYIVFDMLKDYPLDKIRVVSNAPNEWWGVKGMTVKYRSESSSNYYTALSQNWYGGALPLVTSDRNFDLSVPVYNRSARYVIIEIERLHPWQNMPLTKVEIYQGTGSIGQITSPEYTADQLLDELSKTSEAAPQPGQIICGNYIYDNSPDTGSGIDVGNSGLISFENGTLTNGTGWVGWPSNSSGPSKISIVYDLLRDYPLDKIHLVSNAPNEWWGVQGVVIKCRSESENNYSTMLSQQWYGTDIPLKSLERNFELLAPLSNKKARYVIVELYRNSWDNLPLTKVEFYQGDGDVSQSPNPASTAEQLLQEVNKHTRALPQAGQIIDGNYIYDKAPDAGGSPDQGQSGLISFADGLLTDGSGSTFSGWQASSTDAGRVSVVCDLLKDYPLDKIKITSNAPNKYWGVKNITVKYRAESEDKYRILDSREWYGTSICLPDGTALNNTLTIKASDKQARIVIIEISKANSWQNMPLSEIEFYQGTGEVGQNPGPVLTASQLSGEAKKATLTVDKYGQYLYEDWTGKITSDAQLQKDYADESASLSNVSMNLEKYDQYGGIQYAGTYESTGFFRLQKIDDKWWFVTPEGHKFFLKGVDAVDANEWGYSTPYKNPDGSDRGMCEELPDSTTFADSYFGDCVSFIKANIMRKYDSDYMTKWVDITQKRLTDWGFNSVSKWTKDGDLTMPFIAMLDVPQNVIRIQWAQDPFDPDYQTKLETAYKAKLESLKENPNVIGYIFSNEEGWTDEIVANVLQLDESSPAKCAFVNLMMQKYNNDIIAVNQLLGANVNSFDELKSQKIDISKLPSADIKSFIKLASVKYYSSVRNVIKKYDSNHLFLGSAETPGWHSCLDWDTGGVEYLDAISLDTYTNSADYLDAYEPFDKPVINVEYSFCYSGRGMHSLNNVITCSNIAERGEKTKAFIEEQAKSPIFVGSGYFMYYDEPVTGRAGGEDYNFGLVNQQDQPYTDMINIIKVANAGIEAVHTYGTADITAEQVADGINSISAPDVNATSLTLPKMPDGFTLAIKGSDALDVIALDGTVAIRSTNTEVHLVLEVTKVSDGTKADTNSISVTVPAGIVLEKLSLSTDNTFLKPATKASLSLSGELNNGTVADLSQAQVKYSSDNEAVATVDHNGNVTATGEGTTNIKASVTLFGITRACSIKITVDGTAASSSVKIDGTGSNGWYISDVVVTLNASDNLSDVDRTEYKLNDNGDWTAYTGPITLSQEGTHTIQYYSIDKAGNAEYIRQQTIKIDKSAPEFSLMVNGKDLNEGDSFEDFMPLKIKVWDNLSGMAKSNITIDGDYVIDFQAQPEIDIDMSGKPGYHTAVIICEDIAGNLSEQSFSFTIKTSINSMSNLIGYFAKSGDLCWSLECQLMNDLDQAQHKLDIGRPDLAVNHMNNLMKHLSSNMSDNKISNNAIAILSSDAEALSKMWTE